MTYDFRESDRYADAMKFFGEKPDAVKIYNDVKTGDSKDTQKYQIWLQRRGFVESYESPLENVISEILRKTTASRCPKTRF